MTKKSAFALLLVLLVGGGCDREFREPDYPIALEFSEIHINEMNFFNRLGDPWFFEETGPNIFAFVSNIDSTRRRYYTDTIYNYTADMDTFLSFPEPVRFTRPFRSLNIHIFNEDSNRWPPTDQREQIAYFSFYFWGASSVDRDDNRLRPRDSISYTIDGTNISLYFDNIYAP